MQIDSTKLTSHFYFNGNSGGGTNEVTITFSNDIPLMDKTALNIGRH